MENSGIEQQRQVGGENRNDQTDWYGRGIVATGILISLGSIGMGIVYDGTPSKEEDMLREELFISDNIKSFPDCDPKDLLVVIPRSKVVQQRNNPDTCKIDEIAFLSEEVTPQLGPR